MWDGVGCQFLSGAEVCVAAETVAGGLGCVCVWGRC